MKNIALTIILCLPCVLYAQSDSLWRQVYQKRYGAYTETTTFHDKKKRFATVQMLSNKGVVISEVHYRDGLRHGMSRGFYADGNAYWTAHHKDDLLHGAFMVWHKNGEIRRKEFYKNGIRKDLGCFDSTGIKVPFFEFQTLPKFAGGVYALQQFINKNWPKEQSLSTLETSFMSTYLTISVDSVAAFRWINTNNDQFRQALATVINKMPKWIPGTLDGEAIESSYKLMLTIKDKRIYLSELYRDETTVKQRKNLHSERQ